MPEFAPGAEKVAAVEMKNPTAKAWDYSAELYLGEGKLATSGLISFSVPANSSRGIEFPITMPSAEGTYRPYIDIFSDGQLIGAYQAVEDVVIKIPVPDVVVTGATLNTTVMRPGETHYVTVDFQINNHPFPGGAAWAVMGGWSDYYNKCDVTWLPGESTFGSIGVSSLDIGSHKIVIPVTIPVGYFASGQTITGGCFKAGIVYSWAGVRRFVAIDVKPNFTLYT